jgi:hypothetical protein
VNLVSFCSRISSIFGDVYSDVLYSEMFFTSSCNNLSVRSLLFRIALNICNYLLMFISVNQDILLNHNDTDGRACFSDIHRGRWV